MRAIDVPTYNAQEVYQTCINSISDEGLRDRLNLVTASIMASANDYTQKAMTKQLFQIPPVDSDNDDIVVGAVTKKELKSVYSQHMVGRGKPARQIYDDILDLAPLGKCPLCGVGVATTLDHYLPKSKFPTVSVLPVNLVPSCKDCNTGKSADIATTAEEQGLHPYFDHDYFITDQWLFAEVIQTNPVCIRFYVEPPREWDNVSQERVGSHFKDYNLASRFSLEVTNELAILKDTLSKYMSMLGKEAVKQHLHIVATSHQGLHQNSWQTALYQAVSSSEWFCDGGYAQI
ncbi:MAG: HNH endonuclease [Thiotrichaceae bacterium]|nr:MAG: HNH endonuclease [Thiotrichaceae bacterium]